MAHQTVLITGCSTGIGLATAVMMAKDARFKVYATMRNLKSKTDLEKAAGDTLNKSLFIRELDVTKEATIKLVADEILKENGRIDVLVNNAGYTETDAIDQLPLEACQAMMDTNFWGAVRTMRAVLPAMKRQTSGRIINVSSVAAVWGVPFSATYTATKFALEGFTESSASVLKRTYNIRMSLVEPGPVKTALISKIRTLSPAEKSKNFDPPLRDEFLKFAGEIAGPMMKTMVSADEVANLILEAIVSENPHLRYQIHEVYKKAAAKKFIDPHTDAQLDMKNFVDMVYK
ncbi:retinol dehydrogenase 8-like isoform X1 [Acanthaster planci]|uniref:Retinol dehydrogenase 8-like isoform X1 n=3 Tax=Acanthaster planci TaxID=133434 RepID=A0A8B7XLD3_ACAPL|nr:retinol dehydrogenase 8-like isoform X1 [Acanthaster planci]XP_022080927.1 retinol dehydrogenase 8-like isoform X1 [Acanthaster planci]XP_022080929.1 retinol dehydrogenase 8-like isoform X1 [Acanthaster planci]XP_022080930.1 retinol dehydrogenase 8-like isoform X1 [Acanthaster planci]